MHSLSTQYTLVITEVGFSLLGAFHWMWGAREGSLSSLVPRLRYLTTNVSELTV